MPRRLPLVAALLLAAPASADRLVAVPASRDAMRAVRRVGGVVEERQADGSLLARVPAQARANADWRPVSDDARRFFRERALRTWRASRFASFERIVEDMRDAAARHPDFVAAETIGQSVQGRDIVAVRIGNADGPTILVDGAHHGDEPMGAEICRRLVRLLAEGRGADPEVDAALAGTVAWVVPIANPDGYVAPDRLNANGADPNRNYAYMWGGEGGAPYAQPETRAMHELAMRVRPAIGFSFHTREALVNAPWNHTGRRPPDAGAILFVGSEYAATAGYDYVWGYEWYQTLGDADDHLYGVLGALHYTVETSNRDPDTVWSRNRPALLGIFRRMGTGVSVRVRTPEGTPIGASVRIDSGRPQIADARGEVRRPLPAGDHLLVAAAGGFAALRMPFHVDEGALATVDAVLQPGSKWHALSVVGVDYDDLYDEDAGSDTAELLGAPDGLAFAVAPGHSVVLDLGPTSPLVQGRSSGLFVHVAGAGPARCDIGVAASEYGPFAPVGPPEACGAEIRESMPSARYIRLRAPATASLDVDAVEVLTDTPDGGMPDGGAGTPDAGPDAGSKTQPGPAVVGSGGELAGGCSCDSIAAAWPLAVLPILTRRSSRRGCRSR